MKISVEHAPLEENEVILRCSNLDQEMLWVLSILRSGLQKLCAWDERREVTLLSPSEVVYCETALSLAELEGRYGSLGLFRAGKSSIVNLHRVRALKSQPGGRIEVTLETEERLVVSRHYAPLLRERLGL